jgi:hypothetical protein
MGLPPVVEPVRSVVELVETTFATRIVWIWNNAA